MMYEIMTPAEAKALGGLTLAFFGDSVYEVYVREQIVKLGTMPVDKLHKKAVQYVNAGFQSYAYDIIAEQLTEEETEIFKRGRNATGNAHQILRITAEQQEWRLSSAICTLRDRMTESKSFLKRYIQASVHNSREKDYNEGNNKTHADRYSGHYYFRLYIFMRP